MIISEEEKERYLGGIDYVIQSYPHEKIHIIFEISIDWYDFDWNDEDELGELFDDYTKDIPKLGRYFQHLENSKDSDFHYLDEVLT